MKTINAFAPTAKLLKKYPHLRKNWIVPCDQCGRVHVHGAGEGPRAAHCWIDGAKGYMLLFAGEAPSEVVHKLLTIKRRTNRL